MVDKGNKSIEEGLSVLRAVDDKLNEVFRYTNESFSRITTLFTGVFKPLQTHWANTEKITSIYGTANLNMSSVKQGMNILRKMLQLHDVIDQHTKDLREITRNTIRELTATKSSGKRRPIHRCPRLISQNSAVHLAGVAGEYKSYCEQLDESLDSFVRYLSDLEDFTTMLGGNNSPASLSLIRENSELAESVNLFISSFREDCRYRDAFQKAVSEIGHYLSGIPSVLGTSKDVAVSERNMKDQTN